MRINIATMNIWRSYSPYGVRGLMDGWQAQRHGEPYVFAVQEIDLHAPRSGNLDVPKILANGEPHIFATAVAFDPRAEQLKKPEFDTPAVWQYGVGLFTSHCKISLGNTQPLGPHEDVFWRAVENDCAGKWEVEPRTSILAECEAQGHKFWVVTTHLAHTEDAMVSSQFRAAQVQVLMHTIQTVVPTDAPLVVLGDFNAELQNPDLMPLRTVFKTVPVNGWTQEDKKTGARCAIDHIFYRDMNFEGKPQTVKETFSDHRFIRAAFVL